MSRFALASMFLALAVGACSAGPAGTPSPSPGGSPGPTIGPLPTPADHELTTAELKYRLMDTFAPLTYCDPDEYPVSRGDEPQKAVERFPEIQADAETFAEFKRLLKAVPESLGVPVSQAGVVKLALEELGRKFPPGGKPKRKAGPGT